MLLSCNGLVIIGSCSCMFENNTHMRVETNKGVKLKAHGNDLAIPAYLMVSICPTKNT